MDMGNVMDLMDLIFTREVSSCEDFGLLVRPPLPFRDDKNEVNDGFFASSRSNSNGF